MDGPVQHSWAEPSQIFDPAAGVWRPAGFMMSRHSRHAAVLLQDGRGLVAGGSSVVELYDPASDTQNPGQDDSDGDGHGDAMLTAITGNGFAAFPTMIAVVNPFLRCSPALPAR